jgi:hypothetical protein
MMATSLNYAHLPATAHPHRRIVLWIALWALAAFLPLLVLVGAQLDNFFHPEPYGVTTRYTRYHYICGGIVLWLVIWMLAAIRASPRRWRWPVCLLALAWVGANSHLVYEFIHMVRADQLSWR